MDRVQVTRPEQKIIEQAASVATVRAQSVGQTGRAIGIYPLNSVTREGIDEDGEIYTINDFMLGVDTLGSLTAQLRVQGNSKDYGS